MARPAKDEEREERLHREIIVDAYGPDEQAVGWENYLADTLHFPLTARCVAGRAISPLEPGGELEVVGIAPEEECRHEMVVLTRWRPHELAVALMQVEGIDADEQTQQAIEDGHYWVNQGYEVEALVVEAVTRGRYTSCQGILPPSRRFFPKMAKVEKLILLADSTCTME